MWLSFPLGVMFAAFLAGFSLILIKAALGSVMPWCVTLRLEADNATDITTTKFVYIIGVLFEAIKKHQYIPSNLHRSCGYFLQVLREGKYCPLQGACAVNGAISLSRRMLNFKVHRLSPHYFTLKAVMDCMRFCTK